MMNGALVTLTEDKTPIEIALGVDENGMTTARKLYVFLELRKSDFARWVKTNITENEFATENEDWLRFFIDAETPTGGKIQREDYKLTAHFAKKLSCKGHGEKAEMAREYFTRVEEKARLITNRFLRNFKDCMQYLNRKPRWSCGKRSRKKK